MPARAVGGRRVTFSRTGCGVFPPSISGRVAAWLPDWAARWWRAGTWCPLRSERLLWVATSTSVKPAAVRMVPAVAGSASENGSAAGAGAGCPPAKISSMTRYGVAG